MDNEVVNSVINNIAEKLGIAVNYVVPALAKYNIAECIIHLIYFVVYLIATIVSVRFASDKIKKLKESNGEDPAYIILSLLSIAAVIGLGLMMIDNFEQGLKIIKWIMAPEGATIAYILDKIK